MEFPSLVEFFCIFQIHAERIHVLGKFLELIQLLNGNLSLAHGIMILSL